MAIYYAAVEGDPLDSGEGGHVYGTKKTIGTIEDESGMSRRMVFIGDEGYCAKCGSVGAITYGAGMADNRRMVDLVNGGRRQAVGGDIVLCKCATPPRIVAVYGQKFKIIDGGGAMRSGIAENATGAVSPAPQKPEVPRHVRWFYVWDAATGEPLRNRDYVADVAGSRQSGKTDSDGCAKIETDGEQSVEIHATFSSPRRTLKPYRGA
ncbi:hypothetical protein [Paraburkholderia silvatlantica]|uniref:hypothetical protein n=1 Tax=Paraburkholderia silvatlantica TaxID=321895 RepID=UPI0037523885